MQLISCPCIYTVNGMRRDELEEKYPEIYTQGPTAKMEAKFDAEVAKRGGYLPWTGEWPGVAECREKGWFCQDGFGPDSRWGSFCPCPPDAPDAMPDLNRLVHFKATGHDTLYEGCTRVPRRVSRSN
jgi:hypothetical protein